MTPAKKSKDESNLEAVQQKISEMPQHVRATSERVHEVIMDAAPNLKPRIWYGMPGYAASASSSVLVFFRFDERMTLGITEKANLIPAGGVDGLLIPGSWYFEGIDEVTGKRIAQIVREAASQFLRKSN